MITLSSVREHIFISSRTYVTNYLKICQYATGSTVTTSGSEKMVPKHITTPMGIQRLVWAMIIGITPRAVVAEVRKMGRIRRRPASKAASLALLRCTLRRLSAYST